MIEKNKYIDSFEFEQFYEDKDFLREISSIFGKTKTQLLNDVLNAIDEEDLSRVEISIHTLKSATLNFFATGLCDELLFLEQNCKVIGISELKKKFSQFHKKYLEFIDEFDQLTANLLSDT